MNCWLVNSWIVAETSNELEFKVKMQSWGAIVYVYFDDKYIGGFDWDFETRQIAFMSDSLYNTYGKEEMRKKFLKRKNEELL